MDTSPRSRHVLEWAGPTRTILALFLALCPVVFCYGALEPFEACKASLLQVTAVALLVVGWAATRGWTFRSRWQAIHRLFTGGIGMALLAGGVAALLATLVSTCPRTSFQGASDSHWGLGTVASLLVVFAATRTLSTDPRTVSTLLWGVVVGLGVASGYGVAQTAGLDPLRWQDLSPFAGWIRPIGTLGHPNHLAGYAVMALPLVVWLGMSTFGKRARERGTFVIVVALIGGVVIVAALSRGAWLAGAAVGLVFLLCHARMPGHRCVALGLGGLILVGVLTWLVAGPRLTRPLMERARNLGASDGRVEVWKTAWQVFLERPWTGSGQDTFGLAFPARRTPDYWEAEWGILPARAHGDFLEALATRGIPGGLAYLWLPIALALACVRLWRGQPTRRGLVLVLGAVIVAFHVQNLVSFAVISTAGLLVVVAGLVAGMEEDSDPGTNPLPGLAPVAWRALVMPGIVGLLLAGWIGCPLAASVLARSGNDLLASRPAEALERHRWAVRLAPGNELFHLEQSRAYHFVATRQHDATARRRLLEQARDAIESACRLVPLRASNQGNRARMLTELARIGLGTADEVLAAYDLALRLDPCDSLCLADAARAAISLGRHERAREYLAHVRRIDPTLGDGHAELGTLAMLSGQMAEAEQHLHRALESHWHGNEERADRARGLYAAVCVERGKYGLAKGWSENVLARRSDWLSVRWIHALALEGLGLRRKAIAEFRNILERQPDHVQARARLERLVAYLEAHLGADWESQPIPNVR